MSIEKIIRAWKDADYRESLSAEERAALPEHPAGPIALTDEDLGQVAGGWVPLTYQYNTCHDRYTRSGLCC